MTTSTPTSIPWHFRIQVAGLLAVVCAVPALAISAAQATDSSGTVAGHVSIPRPGGYWGDISFFRQDGDGDTVADATVTTTDGGNYIANLPVGSYKVGFSTGANDDFGTAYFKDADTLDAATLVEARDDIPTEDVDADLVIDPAKGQVSGHIAAGAGHYTGNVKFYRVAGNSITSAGSAFAYLGDFDKVLAPGTYTFGFGLDPDDAYLPRYYLNAPELEDATTFEVAAGAVATAETTATTDPGQGVIKGTVATPSGPFNGTATFVWKGPDSADHPTLTAFVGAGSFSRTLRPGTYLVGFSLGADHDGYLSQYFDGKPTEAGATLVTVGAGEQVSGVNGNLDPDLGDGRISGTVTLSDGTGYDGNVSFFRQDSDGDAVADFTSAAADGAFNRALPPGNYKVGFDVGSDDYQPAFYNGVTSLAAATPVKVTAGVTTGQIDAVLVAGTSAPSVPEAPRGVAGNSAAALSWAAPGDGGSPITTYIVRSIPAGIVKSVDASVTQALITGLANGTGYRFTVTAINDMGASPTSPPSSIMTPLPQRAR